MNSGVDDEVGGGRGRGDKITHKHTKSGRNLMPMDDSAGRGWITRPMQRYIEACQLQHGGIRLLAANFV